MTQSAETKYGVVLADPNWSYNSFGAKKHGSPKEHYELATAEDIGKIPVSEWVRKDCVLLLYGTWPKLDKAFEVARAWGFHEYVTGIPWVKVTPSTEQIRSGIGFWFRSTSELLLVFRRGSPPAPDGNKLKKRNPPMGLLCGSKDQFYAPIKEHSAKPLLVYDWARAKLKGPYLELFARNSIFGWTCLGKETGWWLDARGATRIAKDPRTISGALDGF